MGLARHLRLVGAPQPCERAEWLCPVWADADGDSGLVLVFSTLRTGLPLRGFLSEGCHTGHAGEILGSLWSEGHRALSHAEYEQSRKQHMGFRVCQSCVYLRSLHKETALLLPVLQSDSSSFEPSGVTLQDHGFLGFFSICCRGGSAAVSPRELGRQAFDLPGREQLLQSWSSRHLGSQVSWLCAWGLSSLVCPGGLGARVLWQVPPFVRFGVRAVPATPCALCLRGCVGRCLLHVAGALQAETAAVTCAIWVPGRLMVRT